MKRKARACQPRGVVPESAGGTLNRQKIKENNIQVYNRAQLLARRRSWRPVHFFPLRIQRVAHTFVRRGEGLGGWGCREARDVGISAVITETRTGRSSPSDTETKMKRTRDKQNGESVAHCAAFQKRKRSSPQSPTPSPTLPHLAVNTCFALVRVSCTEPSRACVIHMHTT